MRKMRKSRNNRIKRRSKSKIPSAIRTKSIDTIIAYILAALGFVFQIISIIASIISNGKVKDIFPMLIFISVILAITGLFFAKIGFKSHEGSENSKRISLWSNIGVIIIFFIIILIGFI